jgi:hypothetical protein
VALTGSAGSPCAAGLPVALRHHPPYLVADIIGYEQRTALVHRHADGPAERLASLVDKARQYVVPPPAGLPFLKGTKITLYPLSGLRFQEPC